MSRRWNSQEDVKLNHLVRQQKDWKEIVKYFPGRNEREVRSRYVHRFTNRLQKPWSPEEDQKLIDHYYKFGFNKWLLVARQLNRSVRECKDRWARFTAPDSHWSETEDCEIIRMFQAYGANWDLMSNQLRGRSPDEIRNRWESRLRRRYKHSQASRKSDVGIRVTVVRKGSDEWNEGGSEPTYLLPKKEAEDLGYFKGQSRSASIVRQPSAGSSSKHPIKKEAGTQGHFRAQTRSPLKARQSFNVSSNNSVKKDPVDRKEWKCSAVKNHTSYKVKSGSHHPPKKVDPSHLKGRSHSPLKALQPFVESKDVTKKSVNNARKFQPRYDVPSEYLLPTEVTPLGCNSPKMEELPNVSLQDLESEFSSIGTLLPDGDLDDLSRLDMDFVDFFGISMDENENFPDGSLSSIQEAENIPCIPDSNENINGRRPSCLQIPVDVDPLDIPKTRRIRKRKQVISYTHSVSSSSPSPTTPDYLSEFVKSNSSPTEKENQYSDDREEFIRRFKIEVEKDLTELKLKGASSRESIIKEDLFSDENKPSDSPPTLKSYIKREPCNSSQLVSPLNPNSSVDISANRVLHVAKEEEKDSSPPAKRRIVNPRFMHRFDSTERRLMSVSGTHRISIHPRLHLREKRTSHEKKPEDDERTLLLKYDPLRFSFRRVLQIGNDRNWRHVSMGGSRAQLLMTSQAHAFLRRFNS